MATQNVAHQVRSTCVTGLTFKNTVRMTARSLAVHQTVMSRVRFAAEILDTSSTGMHVQRHKTIWRVYVTATAGLFSPLIAFNELRDTSSQPLTDSKKLKIRKIKKV